MRELFQNALNGPGSYFRSNYMMVLVMGLFLYFFVVETDITSREKRLLRLAAVLLALMLFPVSAMALMLYQTRYYSYSWIWSLMPVTLLISWGSVTVLWRHTGQNRRDGRAARRLTAGVAVLLVLLLLTGNLGSIQTLSEEEKDQNNRAEQVAACLQEIPGTKESLLWGSRPVLEAVRRQNSGIKVLYGRNMWEPAVAAHTYDTYPLEQQRLFDWAELIDKGYAYEVSQALTIFLEDRVGDYAQNDHSLADAYMLQLAAEYGAHIWVFPAEASDRMTLACQQLSEEYERHAQAVGEVAGYGIWICD